jgi:Trypsin-like serine proteases, typically periplasmic, contain C-terminal PDZ domain
MLFLTANEHRLKISLCSFQISKMNAAGVLVSCSVAGNETPRRCSGIRLGRDWILTTGGILSSFLQDNNTQSNVSYWKSLLDTTYQDHLVRIKTRSPMKTQVNFSVITSYATDAKDEITSTNKHLLFKEGILIQTNEQFLPQRSVGSNEERHRNSSVLTIGQPSSSDMYGKCEEFNGVLKYIWRSALVSEAVDKMLSSWVMGSISYNEDDSIAETESEITKQLLPFFVILKLLTDSGDISETDEYSKLVDILRDVFEPESVLRRGQNVVVESTPFGNFYFHNSVSAGIISNVYGPSCCLLLTDASTAIGCEGGPIFVVIKRQVFTRRFRKNLRWPAFFNMVWF